MTPCCLIVWPAETHRACGAGADKEMGAEPGVYAIWQSEVAPSFWRGSSQFAIVKVFALNFLHANICNSFIVSSTDIAPLQVWVVQSSKICP